MKEVFLIPKSKPWNTLVKVSYLHDYEPVTTKEEGKRRLNPLQDNLSREIYNFKKNGYPQTRERFRDLINYNFNTAWEHCVCVAVPSHDSKKKYNHICELIWSLVDSHHGLTNATPLLVRTHDIAALHSGGDRRIETHLDSIAVNKDFKLDISGKDILLFDDILTTGNSIRACVSKLKDAGARRVFALVLGKTVSSEFFGADPYIRTSYRDVIKSLSSLEDASKELRLREEMLSLTREDLGDRNPDTLLAMEYLASGLKKEHKFEEERQLREEKSLLLSSIIKDFGNKRPVTISALKQLEEDLRSVGKPEEERQLREEKSLLLSSIIKDFGNERPVRIFAMKQLEVDLRSVGKDNEVQQLREERVSLTKEAFVQEKPETIPIMKCLDEGSQKAIKSVEAMQLRTELNNWLFARAVYGSMDSETRSAEESLKESLTILGKTTIGSTEGALQLRKDIFSVSQLVYKEELKIIIPAMKQLEKGLQDVGNVEELLDFYEYVLSLKNNVLGKVIPEMFIRMHQMADNLGKAGRGEDTVAFRRKLLVRCKESLGEYADETLLTMTNLAKALKNIGRSEEAVALEKERDALLDERRDKMRKGEL